MAYPPAPPAQPAQPVQKQGNGFGVTALVLGIIGAVFAFIPAVNIFIAIPLGILSLIFGFVALGVSGKRGGKGKGTGGVGVVLGLVAIGVTIAVNIWFVGEVTDQACTELGYDSQEECDQYLEDLENELEQLETE